MKKPSWWAFWLLLIELLVVLIIWPGDRLERVQSEEAALVSLTLGEDTQDWIQRRADGWYQKTMIDSGLYQSLHYFIIPTEEEKQRSGALKDFGGVWFDWIGERLESLMAVIYQLFTRFALVLLWAPYMLLLLIPAIYDGLMQREIKRTNFAYASPVIHRYSLRGAGTVLMLLLMAFFAPIAVNPAIIPVVLMICCVLMGLMTSNLQKRV